jgi:hypothetical protein
MGELSYAAPRVLAAARGQTVAAFGMGSIAVEAGGSTN